MFTPEDFPDDSGTFFQFSPFSLHQEDPFLQILPQQLVTDAMGISRESTTLEETMLNKSSDGNGKNGESSSKRLYRKNGKTTPRKRSGKKDRHSKIVTAQGTRDRRMRLSLDIARRFFNLQDMLGFDIASRTVEWLLKQSEEAIHELRKSWIGNTRTGECGEASKTGLGHNGVSKGMTVNKSLSSRDLRVQARARARERTLEKMRIEKGPQYLNQLQSSNTLIPNVVDQSRGGSCSNVRPSTQVLARFSHSPRPQDNLPNFQGIWNDDIAKRFLDSEGNVELHKGFTDKLKSVKGSSQSLSFSCLSNAHSSFRATTSSPFPWNQ